MILFAGCTLQQEVSKSDSFGDSIILERTGMFTMPEFGIQIYTLTQSNLNVKMYSYDGSLTKDINFSLFPGITYQVFEEFEKVNFTNLNDNYQSSLNVADVGQGVFSYNNHSVLIMPYVSQGNPSEISNLIEAFNNLLGEVNMSEVFILENQVEEVGVVTYSYTGIQCVDEPWMINSPTKEAEIKKIEAYYSKRGVEIENIVMIESDVLRCQACNTCSKSFSYEVQVIGYQEILENDGWRTQGRDYTKPSIDDIY